MSVEPIWHLILWIHFSAVGLWIGGIVVLGVIAAPVLHRSLLSPALAGEMAGRMFKRLNGIELFCFGLLIVTSCVFFRFVSPNSADFCQWIFSAVILMGVLTLAYAFYLTPWMDKIKESVPLHTLPKTDIYKIRFDRLHRIYVWMMMANLILGLAVIYLSVLAVQ